MDFNKKEKYGINDLICIMKILRGENGCPWDMAQTHRSIRKNLLEEAYETAEAIDFEDNDMLKEELGDLLLQVVFHAEISNKENAFDFNDICDGICKKLIFRHPHVFGDKKANNGEEALNNWNSKKMEEKGQNGIDSVNSVSKALPALMYTDKVLSRAEKLGLTYGDENEILKNLNNQIINLEKIINNNNMKLTGDTQDILGEMLFNTVKWARIAGIDLEDSLHKYTDGFIEKIKEDQK